MRAIPVAFAVWVFHGAALTAQTTTARLLGTISDSSGAAVTAAAVTVTNPETGARREASTDSSAMCFSTLES